MIIIESCEVQKYIKKEADFTHTFTTPLIIYFLPGLFLCVRVYACKYIFSLGIILYVYIVCNSAFFLPNIS